MFEHIRDKKGNFTSNIHMFLLKIENKYDKHLISYQSWQENSKLNQVNTSKSCLKQNNIQKINQNYTKYIQTYIPNKWGKGIKDYNFTQLKPLKN